MKYSIFLEVAKKADGFASLGSYFVDYTGLKDIILKIEALSGGSREGDQLRVEFKKKLAEDMARIDKVAVHLLRSFQDRLLEADIFVQELSDLYPASSASTYQLGGLEEGSRPTLSQLYQTATLLNQYCELNSEGARKIAKKYDKRAGGDGEQVRTVAKLQKSTFGGQRIRNDLKRVHEALSAKEAQTDRKEVDVTQALHTNTGIVDVFVELFHVLIKREWGSALSAEELDKLVTPEATPSGRRFPWPLKVLALSALLYLFCLGLVAMGDGFKLLSGPSADAVFAKIENPIAGLIVGILATALVQSSHTTTAIAVALVGSGSVSLTTGIPIIMGANIGTSVTATIVSLGYSYGDPEAFARAFSSAAVHNVFNVLTVLVLFPLEAAFHPLRGLCVEVSSDISMGGGGKWEGPLKKMISPVWKSVVSVDKKKINAAAEGKEVAGSFMKGGWLMGSGISDGAAGVIALLLGLAFIFIALMFIFKLLKSSLSGKAAEMIRAGLDKNAYVNMFIGVVVTVLVQSSSITTSTLVPLAAAGAVTVEQILPVCLGANIGTTMGAFLASLAADRIEGLQLALCHLLFNVIGILIFFPVPPVRAFMVGCAVELGAMVSKRRVIGLLYVAVFFFIVPFALLLMSWASNTVAIIGFVLIMLSVVLGFCKLKMVLRASARNGKAMLADGAAEASQGDANVETIGRR